MAMDQLSHRLPAADSVAERERHLSCGLPCISRIGAGIGQSRYPKCLKNSKIKTSFEKEKVNRSRLPGKRKSPKIISAVPVQWLCLSLEKNPVIFQIIQFHYFGSVGKILTAIRQLNSRL